MAEEIKKAPLNASIAPEEFDWDAFESTSAPGEENRAEIEAA